MTNSRRTLDRRSFIGIAMGGLAGLGVATSVEQAVAKFEADGYKAMIIPVSHAFHTEIIAPADCSNSA